MSEQIPEDLQYTRSHEWVRALPNGQVEVGITDHAQAALGDLVFVEVPQVGSQGAPWARPAPWSNRSRRPPTSTAPSRAEWLRATRSLSQKPELLNSRPLWRGLADAHGARCSKPGAALLSPSGVRSSSSKSPSRSAAMPFIPHTPDDIADMLAVIGAPSIDELFDEIPAALKAKRSRRRSAGALRNGGRAAPHRTRRGRRPPAEFHRRGRVRAPYSRSGLGHRDARRILFGVHALSGGGKPGHVAADLRVPVDDLRPHRHGGRERLALRRRLRARPRRV